MNRFYRKPKPETMKRNRDFYKQNFDLIYIDGPTARPLNNSERKLKILVTIVLLAAAVKLIIDSMEALF